MERTERLRRSVRNLDGFRRPERYGATDEEEGPSHRPAALCFVRGCGEAAPLGPDHRGGSGKEIECCTVQR
jgi:hypothetical protein